MLSLSMSCFQLKHLSSAVRSISNHRPISRTIINLSVLETPSHQCQDFKEFKQLLSQMIFTGFIKHTFAAKRLVQFCTRDLRFLRLDYSYKIFNLIENPDASLYNIMIMAYVRRKYPHRAIHFYRLMLYRNVGPNVYTYPFLVEACAMRASYSFLVKACAMRESHFEGEQMHNHVLKLGFDSDVHVRSTLVDMYADCDRSEDALKVFNEGPMTGSFVWYSLLETHCFDVEGAEYFYNLIPEKDTIASNFMIVSFWYRYGGKHEKAEQLINEIPENDTVSWSGLINCFQSSFREMYEEALDIFIRMHANGITIDKLVVKAILFSCIKLTQLHKDVKIMGKLIHSLVVKIGIESDVELQNRLIRLYSECEDILSAQNLFNTACRLDQHSWNNMLFGYVNCGLDENVKALFESMLQKDLVSCHSLRILYESEHHSFSERLALFLMMVKMAGPGIRLDEDTWYVVIMGLPFRYAVPDLGKCIHGYLIKNGNCLKDHGDSHNALWRMYKRCGIEHKGRDERGFY